MKTSNSFERQLQDIEAPAADPAARARARDAAMAEFRRMHPESATRTASRSRQRAWMPMLAAASVAAIGVAIVWRMPADQRVVGPAQPRVIEATIADAPPMSPGGDAAAGGDSAAEVDVAAVDAPATEAPAAEAIVDPSPRAAAPASPAEPGTATLGETSPTTPAPPSAATAPAADKTSAQPASSGPPPPPTPVLAPVITSGLPPPPTLPRPPPPEADMTQVVITGSRIVAPVTRSQLDPAESFAGPAIANLRGMDPTSGRTLALIDGRRIRSGAHDIRALPQPSRDRFVEFESNPVKRTAEEPVSTFSLDVDTSSYSFVRREILNGRLPPREAVRVEELVNYFDYAWPAAQSRSEPFGATVTVSDSPWAEGRKLVHIGIKGYEIDARRQPDSNLVLLLDVSGSMNEPDKLPLARRSMRLLLDALKPTDTVSIVTYAGSAGEVLGPTPASERGRIEAALDQLRPGGSTAGAQGIRLAYELAQRSFRRDGVNRILLATDGDFNVGVSDPGELTRLVEQERERGIYLSVLGFGQGNYRDDIAQALAQNGNGVAAYIDSLTEARKVLVREATSSLFPIAGDVKIQVEFNPDAVAEYRLIGYETRGLAREDFNNDQVDAAEVGSGRSVTAIYEVAPVGSGAQLIDGLRYGDTTARAQPSRRRGGGELGYLKIRYKLPGDTQSKLIERPIRAGSGVPRSLREPVAFSTAVAAFGQLLRSSAHTSGFSHDQVLELARQAKGDDPHGDRAEFIMLVEEARALARRDAAF